MTGVTFVAAMIAVQSDVAFEAILQKKYESVMLSDLRLRERMMQTDRDCRRVDRMIARSRIEVRKLDARIAEFHRTRQFWAGTSGLAGGMIIGGATAVAAQPPKPSGKLER
jgi:hypothetical protein